MLSRIPEHFGLDIKGVFEEVHGLGHFAPLAAYLDETFLAARHGPERRNVIDDYLRHRGWQETPRARQYLQGIRDTPPSLYEVHDVEQDHWIEVRDRLRGGPPVRVFERSGSQTLQRWDCIVARVVHPRDEEMLTGGVLSLSRPMADDIESLFRKVEKRSKRDLASVARELGVEPSAFGEVTGSIMEFADRLCLHGWLKGLLEVSRRPLPALHNTDGDPLLPTRTRLPIKGAAIDAARTMDTLSGWQRIEGDETRWNWSTGADDSMGKLLGSAWVENRALVVETNSRERMARALEVLQPALGSLVAAGLTVHEDMTRDLEAAVRSGRPAAKAPTTERSPGDAAAIAEAVGRTLDAHYRRTLDEPVPALGNRTPRECARTKTGRRQLVSWLKDIENGELRRAAGQRVAPHNLRWMWTELGVENER